MTNTSPASRSVELRFLIVGNNLAAVEALALTLRDRGYSVQVAESGDEALAKMDGAFFDCVLSEAHMPGMSGVDLCREVKARCPETEVLLMAAHVEDSLAHDAWKQGAAAVLQEPFDVDSLLAFLSALRTGWKAKGKPGD